MSKKFSKKIILMLFLFSLRITQDAEPTGEAALIDEALTNDENAPIEAVEGDPVIEQPPVDPNQPPVVVVQPTEPAEPVDPNQPPVVVVQPTEPAEPVDPNQPPVVVVQPTEPVDPNQPPVIVVQPTEPVNPNQPPVVVVQPTEPAEPVDPNQPPVVVVQPTEPVDPNQPTVVVVQPTEPVDPNQPPVVVVQPTEPAEPVDPNQPPVVVVQPTQPVDPNQPPVIVVQPAEPVDPNQPPVVVVQPTEPAEPVDPNQPPVIVVQPAEPVDPNQPTVVVVQPTEPVDPNQPPVVVVQPTEPVVGAEPEETPKTIEELDAEIKDVEDEIKLQEEGDYVPEDLAENKASLDLLRRQREALTIPQVQPVIEEVEIETPEVIEPVEVNTVKDKFWRHGKVERDFRNLGYIAAILFFLSMLIGLLGLFYFCPCLTDRSFYDFYYQKFLQTFLMGQFIAFWVLYNAELPKNLLCFLHAFFQWTVQWHDIFLGRAKSNHGDIFNRNEFSRYYEEDVSNQFVISFGFILLIQGIVLIIALIIMVLNKGKQAKLLAENYNELSRDERIALTEAARSSERLNNHFWAKLVYTVFMMFIIETLVFALYNFYRSTWSLKDHKILQFSFALAIIWIIIIALLWFLNLAKAAKNEQDRLEHDYNGTWGFITTGLEHNAPRKFFQGIQYLVYGLFAIILVIAYRRSKTQIIINYVIFVLFAFYVMGLRPPNTPFWKLEQTIVHLLLLIAKTFLFALALDSNRSFLNMSAKQAWILGYFAAIFAFLVIVWNFLILLWKLFEHMQKCKAARLGTGFTVVRPHMKTDRDEEMDLEMANTLFRDVQRKVVEREVKEESLPSYIQKDFDTRKARFYKDVESKPDLKGFNLVNNLNNPGQLMDDNVNQIKQTTTTYITKNADNLGGQTTNFVNRNVDNLGGQTTTYLTKNADNLNLGGQTTTYVTKNVDNLGGQTTNWVNNNTDNLGGKTTTVIRDNLGNVKDKTTNFMNKKSMGDFAQDFMRNDNN